MSVGRIDSFISFAKIILEKVWHILGTFYTSFITTLSTLHQPNHIVTRHFISCVWPIFVSQPCTCPLPSLVLHIDCTYLFLFPPLPSPPPHTHTHCYWCCWKQLVLSSMIKSDWALIASYNVVTVPSSSTVASEIDSLLYLDNILIFSNWYV